MCKVFGVAGVNDSNRGDVIRLLKEITPGMTKMENHGFGYAAIDAEGHIFGEKWTNVDHAWKKRIRRKSKPASEIPKGDVKMREYFDDVITFTPTKGANDAAPPVYDRFGNKDKSMKDAVAFIMHSRFSTGAPHTIPNTHPFVNAGTALVHNGIVFNDYDFYKNMSQCDSEILLHQYNNHVVNLDSRNLTKALSDVDAYLACLVLTQAMVGDDTETLYPVLDIFKADANLTVTYINELDLFVWCTRGSLVTETCKKLGWSTSAPCDVDDEVLIRLDAVTGEPIEKQEFIFAGQAYNNYNGWGSHYSSNTPSEETILKSKYGDDWEKHKGELSNGYTKSAKDSAQVLLNSGKGHNESDPENEPEPSYRTVGDDDLPDDGYDEPDNVMDVTTFIDKGNGQLGDPFEDGSDLSSEEVNDVILNDIKEREELDKIFKEHMKSQQHPIRGGVRHAK